MKILKKTILVGLLVVSCNSFADINTGLIAYYPFNGNANDESGNGNNGIVQGNANLTTDMFGNTNSAYSFDGENSYIDINLPTINTKPNSKVTMSFWVNWNGNNYGLPFGFEGYDVWFSNGYFGFNTDQNDIWGISSNSFVNHWVFVTAVFNNGDITKSILYVNGAKKPLTQKQSSPIIKSVSTNARIGYYIGGCGNCNFGGKIDNVRIYNRALSNSDVTELYYTELPPVVGGNTSWTKNPYSVICTNNTTGQTVTISNNKTASYDCGKSGLVTHSNDDIAVTVRGKRH